MAGIGSPATIDRMFRATPGSVTVSYGGINGWGHYEPDVAVEGAVPGVSLMGPVVFVADCHFPGIGSDEDTGRLIGSAQNITVNDRVWNIRDIGPGRAPGELAVFLANRKAPDG